MKVELDFVEELVRLRTVTETQEVFLQAIWGCTLGQMTKQSAERMKKILLDNVGTLDTSQGRPVDVEILEKERDMRHHYAQILILKISAIEQSQRDQTATN